MLSNTMVEVNLNDSSNSCFLKAVTAGHSETEAFPWRKYTQTDNRQTYTKKGWGKTAERMQLLSYTSFLCSVMSERLQATHSLVSQCKA